MTEVLYPCPSCGETGPHWLTGQDARTWEIECGTCGHLFETGAPPEGGVPVAGDADVLAGDPTDR